MDRLVGGVGLRRGRRDADSLKVGDALDWWRVEECVDEGVSRLDPDETALAPGERLLRLRAEMKAPGLAWLELRVAPTEDGSIYRQRAIFFPHGLAGHAYWYVIAPFHALVFGGMERRIVGAAERVERGEDPEPPTGVVARLRDRRVAPRRRARPPRAAHGDLTRPARPGPDSRRQEPAASSVATVSRSSSRVAAAQFSARCSSELVPGMGSITELRCSSHASATCAGVAPSASAARCRGVAGLGELAGVGRGPRDEPDAVRGAVAQHVVRGAVDQVVAVLHRGDVDDASGRLDLRDGDLAQADLADLALALQVGEQTELLVGGDVRVDAVELEEVERLHAEAAQAHLGLLAQVLRAPAGDSSGSVRCAAGPPWWPR